LCSYHPAKIPKISENFSIVHSRKIQIFGIICWMIRTQPFSLLKLFLLYYNSSVGLIFCSKKKILGVESCDFSPAEKAITACKAEQIHKMTPVFTQNDIQGPF
jgi:hypothetical protein